MSPLSNSLCDERPWLLSSPARELDFPLRTPSCASTSLGKERILQDIVRAFALSLWFARTFSTNIGMHSYLSVSNCKFLGLKVEG